MTDPVKLVDCIAPGDSVWIVDRFGVEHKGKAVMRSSIPGTWVLNGGGPHGTPRLADDNNITRVRKAKQKKG